MTLDIPRASTTSTNGEISCSIEETNRIRLSLGLKPLRTVSLPETTAPPSSTASPDSKSLQTRLKAAKKARLDRSITVASRSIAQQALQEADDEDDDANAQLTAWVNRFRTSTHKEEPRTSNKVVTKSENLPKVHVQPSIHDDVSVETGETKVLILADTNVADDANQDDLLQQITQPQTNLKAQSDINGLAYDGTDSVEFKKNPDDHVKPGAISLEPSAPIVESDYKQEVMNAFSKRKGRRDNKKRRRKSERGVKEPVSKGHMLAVREMENAKWANESDDDDALYVSLAKARKRSEQQKVLGSVDIILQAIEKANDADADEKGNAIDQGAQVVYDEMELFLGQLPSAADISDEENSIDMKDVKENHTTESHKDIEDSGRNEEQGSLSSLHNHSMEKADSGVEVNGNDDTKQDHVTVEPSTDDGPDQAKETNGMNGIAATLQMLRGRGDLKHRPPQKGRARDKPFENDDTTNGMAANGRREVRLSYLDDEGNHLTPKEAFRLLCHKFHGKGPGQNKREKRLKNMLESLKQRSIYSNDTPLASAAALKEETRKLGTAHVVLSGSQALMRSMSTDPAAIEAAKTIPASEIKDTIDKTGPSAPVPEEEKIAFSLSGVGGNAAKRRRR